MEATQVTQHIKVLSQVAVTLSTEERMQLEYAFDQLQSAMKFESLHLWGKIQGIETDYYIAVGMNSTGRKDFP
jgi:radial spoke head protein 9